MAVSVNWATRVIFVPRADLPLIQSSPNEIRGFNINWFWHQLADLQDTEDGMCFPVIFINQPPQNLSGIDYARIFAIINGYTVTFEDGQYAVQFNGANTNVQDVTNVNQVSIRPNNSAGMTSSEAIEYSSFENCVTVDVTSSTVGTVYPAGTRRMPVNNIPDALIIAGYRGFDTLRFIGSITLGAGALVEGYTLEGSNPIRTMITILPAALTQNCEIKNASVQGVLDGNTLIKDCKIYDLLYFNGAIKECDLVGVITLGGGAVAHISDCQRGADNDISGFPYIDMGVSGQDLILTGWDGALGLRNMSGNNSAVLAINSGHLTIDDTITNGVITVRGIVGMNDNHGGTAIVNTDDVVAPSSVTNWTQFRGEVYLDPVSGVAGQEYPTGTHKQPSNNFTDAYAICVREGLRNIAFEDEITISVPVTGCHIRGAGAKDVCVVNLNNQLLTDVAFEHCVARGRLNAAPAGPGSGWGPHNIKIQFENCYLESIEDLEGIAENCQIEGTQLLAAGGWFSSIETVIEGDFTFFDLRSTAETTVSMDMNSGWAQFINAVEGCLIELNVKGGEVSLYASCTGGDYYLEGIGTLFNESAMTVLENHLPWDEMIAYHEIEGSTGKALSDGGAGGLTPEDRQKLIEVWQFMGLNPAEPLISSPTTMTAGSEIVLDIHDESCVVTVRRRA